MKSPYPKYQFQYSKTDYDYNSKIRSHAQAVEKPKSREFYIQITDDKVQKISEILSQQILQGLKQRQERIFVRVTEIGGHCIDLHSLRLLNVLNGRSRQIYKSVPQGMQLINGPSPLQPQTPPSKLGYVPMHWYEKIKQSYRPLQISVSDMIERCYNNHINGGNSAVYEFSWQEYRFILDLINMTLQNCNNLETNHIQRRNIKDHHKYETNRFLNETLNTCYVWQYCICNRDWYDYDKDNNKKLEEQFIKYQKNIKKVNSFKVKRNNSKFYIDFIKMIEYSTIDKSYKQIRRLIQE